MDSDDSEMETAADIEQSESSSDEETEPVPTQTQTKNKRNTRNSDRPAERSQTQEEPAVESQQSQQTMELSQASSSSEQAGGDGDPGERVENDPWPHIKMYFEFSASNPAKKSVTYVCVLCKPKKVPITAHVTSLYNLKSHVKRVHSAKFLEFQDQISMGSKRGQHNVAKRDRKGYLSFIFSLTII